MSLKRVILSGIQPTGVPHLGNYLGAIKNWVSLQREPDTNILLSVVDLHAITVPQDPKTLERNIMEMGAALLACGVDPAQCALFRQSHIHQHAELGWVLFCKTPVTWLTRMHQWKTKTAAAESDMKSIEGANGSMQKSLDGRLGLLSYPVLQAADILLYNATHVPVGEDQSQHINLTTDIAKSFNSQYKKKVFTVPLGWYPNDGGSRIRSLKTPLMKMSKSDGNPLSRIDISDSADEIRNKIKKATTDSESGISYTSSRPGIMNLLNIYMSIQDVDAMKRIADPSTNDRPFLWADLDNQERKSRIEKEFGSMQTSKLKDAVVDVVVDHLSPIRTSYLEYKASPDSVVQIFKEGEETARNIACKTLSRVYSTIGIR